jgi:signal transduction histidine kinase
MPGPLASALQVALLAGSLGYLALGVRSLEHTDEPAGEPFTALAAVAGVSGLVLSVPQLVGLDASIVLRSYLAVYLLPVPWAVFALEYVGYAAIRSRRVLAVVVAPPVAGLAFNLAVWGYRPEGLLAGLLSVGNVLALLALAFATGLALLGVGVLAWAARRQQYVERLTVTRLLVGGAAPWVAVLVAYQVGWLVGEGFLPSVTEPAVLVAGYGAGLAALAGMGGLRRPLERLAAPGTVGPDAVFEQLHEPVMLLDREGRVVRLNPAARERFVTDGADPAGEELSGVLGMALAALREEPQVELSVAGEPRVFEPVVTTLADDAGRPTGHAVVLHDVTDREGRKRRIEELARAREQLRRKNERLDEFASVVSHDLRNPLTVARGFTQTARQDDDVSKLDRVEDAHERMDRMLEELLALARAGFDRGDAEPVDLSKLARDAWRTVDTPAMELVVEPDAPTVPGDEATLRQALENLFRNAAEHAVPDDPAPATAVTVTVGGLPDGFYVADDGPGIPAEEREQVFEHGFTTSGDGTGFGLSIVQQVFEAHNWTVRVAEGSDGGARFEVRDVATVED